MIAVKFLKISIPNLSLVVLIGPSGSGKSTFARKHFLPTEVLSSDACRGMVSDDENNQAVTNEAFALLHLHRRPAPGPGTADGHRRHQRAARIPQAAGRACPQVPLPPGRHRAEPARTPLPGSQPLSERAELRPSRCSPAALAASPVAPWPWRREGFRHVFVLESPEEVEAATVERVPLWNDKRQEHGPFDIIGDVHGCCDELEALLQQLGYQPTALDSESPAWGNRRTLIPMAARRSSSAIWWTVAHAFVDTVRLVRNMIACWLGPVRARQPRHEADAEAPGQGCPDHARPGEQPCRNRRLARRCSCGRSARNWPSSLTAW